MLLYPHQNLGYKPSSVSFIPDVYFPDVISQLIFNDFFSCAFSFSSDKDRFHYCSQSRPSGQLLCSTVHLNIILLIKGLPPTTAALLPPLPFSHMAPAFVHPGTHPLASCQATLLPFQKKRRHLCLYLFHLALISTAILWVVFCVQVSVCRCACISECLWVFIQGRFHQG